MLKTSVQTRVGRKLMHYMLNRGLAPYIVKKIEEFKSGRSLVEISHEANLVLFKHGIPVHWIDFVLSYVTNNPVEPDHEYLALKVGEKRIFKGNFKPETIKQYKGTSLCIEVNGRISKTELKKFIDQNNELIKKITNLLELPSTQYFKGNSFDEDLMASLYRELGHPVSEVSKLVEIKMSDSLDYSTTKKRIKRGNKTRDTL